MNALSLLSRHVGTVAGYVGVTMTICENVFLSMGLAHLVKSLVSLCFQKLLGRTMSIKQ